MKMLKAGTYRIIYSGFFGNAWWRSVKDTGKKIKVSTQPSSPYAKGCTFRIPNLFHAKELEEMNRKLNPENHGVYVIAVD
ncbi:MAG: hypothetical protein ABFD50_15445 [Smithella sp.]